MLTSKKTTLYPLLNSSGGIHLTAYLVNRGQIEDLKMQLQEVVHQSYEWLYPVMTTVERNKFLEPIDALLEDSRIFRQIKGNIGIFRNQDSFRILSIPTEVDQTCQIATSFHVKPLIKWLQSEQEFLFLGVSSYSAHLYAGTLDSFRLVDSFFFAGIQGHLSPVFQDRQSSIQRLDLVEEKAEQHEASLACWLNENISEMTKKAKPKLFFAGDKKTIENVRKKLDYKNAIKIPVTETFCSSDVAETRRTIQNLLKAESKARLQKILQEFKFAEAGNRTKKNIFQIAKAAVRGQVRKLVITDEMNIFGKVDKQSGGLALHPIDLDHEDDDILDDLAQIVLKQGGDVFVAPQKEIPNGRPILAILDGESPELAKSVSASAKEFTQEKTG